MLLSGWSDVNILSLIGSSTVHASLAQSTFQFVQMIFESTTYLLILSAGSFSDKSAQKSEKCHHTDWDFVDIWYIGLFCPTNKLV